MEGFRFLVPLVRPGWKIIKRTFMAGKGDGVGRKERKGLGFTISSSGGWTDLWGGPPAVWRVFGWLPKGLSI